VRHGYKHLFILAAQAYNDLERHLYKHEPRQKEGQVEPPSEDGEWYAQQSWSQLDFKHV